MEQDIPVYVLANFVVSDKDQYRVYEKGLFPILKRFGGHLVTFDDATETLEGPSPRQGRLVILGFPSEAQARAWWADEEYQALSEYRRAGTTLDFITLVKGLPPRKA